MTRLLRLAGTAALLLAVAAPAAPWAAGAATPPACGPGGSSVEIGGAWLALSPKFPAGPSSVRLVSAPVFAPDVVYASNGAAVMRTTDAGCSWTTVYRASTTVPTASAEVTALLAPSSASSNQFLYVGVTTRLAGGVTSPSVAVSSRQGAPGSWSTPDPKNALPLLGSVTDLAASPQLPSQAYAVITVNAAAAQRSSIYATSDAGTTWSVRTPAGEDFGGRQLVAHPSRQVGLFALQGTRLVRSDDGGASFTATSDVGPLSTYSAAGGAGGVRLAAALADRPGYARSDDDGSTWTTESTPVDVSDLAMAPLQDVVGFSAGTDFYLENPVVGQVRRSPGGGAPAQLAISAPTRDGFVVTGLRDGAVLRLVVGLDLRPVPPGVGPDGMIIPVRIRAGGTQQFPSVLTPDSLHVSLPAGGRAVVPYRLLIPRTPTPLDAMFLVDTTGSMGGTINGLRKDLAAIVTALDAAGLDAQFGLGDFQDYPTFDGDTDHAYQLDRRIGPANAELRAALNNLTLGGGGDGPEAVLTALLQSTTGQGDFSVRKGQQARYRPPALKLAFTATDNPFHQKGDPNWNTDSNGRSIPWPGPGWSETMSAMRKAGVHQVGLAVDPAAAPDMERAARETRTFAPPGGVDCNGDGLVDVQAGEPLVCDISNLASAPVGVDVGGTPDPGVDAAAVGVTAAVVALANGIPDLQPVRLRVDSGRRFARIVTGSPRQVLNLKADNDLGYGLELRCPAGRPAQQRIGLTASTPARQLATAHVLLDCGGVTRSMIGGIPPAAAVAVAPAAAPAAAQPMPNPNPQPNPNPNPQPQPNLNMNSGVVEQSQEEAQLALAVGNAEALQPDEELAMSARRTTSDADLAFVAAAALLLTVATGVAVRVRSRLCTG